MRNLQLRSIVLTFTTLITACSQQLNPRVHKPGEGIHSTLTTEIPAYKIQQEQELMTEAADFFWLEEVKGERALKWVKEQNELSVPRLEGDERFKAIRQAAERIYTAKDRIAYGEYFSGMVHNFWQDDQHVRGIWRRASLENYTTEATEWEIILDMDALAVAEQENWVFKGYECLAPENQRCLIHLSRGGGDAVVVREFDMVSKQFIENGFELTEAKTNVAWLDQDRLLVATDFGADSLTTSGYARTIRLWSRDTDINTAELIFAGQLTDTLVSPMTLDRPEGQFTFLKLIPEFFKAEHWYVEVGSENARTTESALTLKKLPFPIDADFQGVFAGRLLALLRSDWIPESGTELPEGSLVAIDMQQSLSAGKAVAAELIIAPSRQIALQDVTIGKNSVLVSAMEDVNGVLFELTINQAGGWSQLKVDLPEKGSIDVVTSDVVSGTYMVNFESYLIPPGLYLVAANQQPRIIKSLAEKFDSSDYILEQLFAESSDGTRVPYFIVRQKDLPLNGDAPTLLGAYGGFEVSLRPTYLTALGIGWLNAGGIFVIANLRGGGEYGPAWHRAALRENRQLAYDDFIAVAEDLIDRKYTNSRHLGIRGGSNGGLLIAAVMIQRPELYNAIICAVPLLDMIRYNKLSAGASWMAEYGNPDIPEQKAYIEKYSPYQNLDNNSDYPEVFFWTNTLDDRVHPSHARRMVAKMKEQHHAVLYFENTEGGHGGGANLLQLARTTAYELVYLLQKLKD